MSDHPPKAALIIYLQMLSVFTPKCDLFSEVLSVVSKSNIIYSKVQYMKIILRYQD